MRITLFDDKVAVRDSSFGWRTYQPRWDNGRLVGLKYFGKVSRISLDILTPCNGGVVYRTQDGGYVAANLRSGITAARLFNDRESNGPVFSRPADRVKLFKTEGSGSFSKDLQFFADYPIDVEERVVDVGTRVDCLPDLESFLGCRLEDIPLVGRYIAPYTLRGCSYD